MPNTKPPPRVLSCCRRGPAEFRPVLHLPYPAAAKSTLELTLARGVTCEVLLAPRHTLFLLIVADAWNQDEGKVESQRGYPHQSRARWTSEQPLQCESSHRNDGSPIRTRDQSRDQSPDQEGGRLAPSSRGMRTPNSRSDREPAHARLSDRHLWTGDHAAPHQPNTHYLSHSLSHSPVHSSTHYDSRVWCVGEKTQASCEIPTTPRKPPNDRSTPKGCQIFACWSTPPPTVTSGAATSSELRDVAIGHGVRTLDLETFASNPQLVSAPREPRAQHWRASFRVAQRREARCSAHADTSLCERSRERPSLSDRRRAQRGRPAADRRHRPSSDAVPRVHGGPAFAGAAGSPMRSLPGAVR